MEVTRLSQNPWFKYGVLYALWLALVISWFMHAWISEDAYITFRVVDNFLHGYGLRWNTFERVQPYTHPLWMLVHIPLVALWQNIFHASIALSLVCSAAAVALVLYTFRTRPLPLILGFFLLPLALSKCFRDYTTSGLETSLSFLLFAVIGYIVMHRREWRFFWLAFTLLCSLLLVNRLDHVLLIAPLYAWICWQERPRYRQLALGLLPLILWHSFSLFYYGFFFPNTKYAKLNTGFPLSDYLLQGAHYSFIWLTNDTASVLILLAALIFAACQWKKLPRIHAMLAVGVLLNTCYVIYIGGDYMMGRFWAFPFFVCTWLLIASLPENMRLDYWATGLFSMLACASVPYFIEQIRIPCPTCIPVKGRVLDAQNVFWRNQLFDQYWPPRMRMEGQHKFGRKGKAMAAEGIPVFKIDRSMGMMPFYTGASSIYIDELGLADALLARLPAGADRTFYVGHYRRDIPEGYEDAVHYGRLERMQPDLARYYEKLRLITQGELWDGERFKTIIRFNLGEYDRFRQLYLIKTQ